MFSILNKLAVSMLISVLKASLFACTKQGSFSISCRGGNTGHVLLIIHQLVHGPCVWHSGMFTGLFTRHVIVNCSSATGAAEEPDGGGRDGARTDRHLAHLTRPGRRGRRSRRV